MFLVEQVTNHVRFLLPMVQVTPDISDYVRFVGRALLPKRVGFHILIQQLIRVQFGTVVFRVACLSRRFRNSMNVAFLNVPSKTMRLNLPRLVMAKSVVQLKCFPVARTIGVCPVRAELVG
ncbi:hypothetical protein WK65_29940 [Burkholderia ubonensis]|nr:hypothetical protein WK65_29940 [Burkholderia ubonensis]